MIEQINNLALDPQILAKVIAKYNLVRNIPSITFLVLGFNFLATIERTFTTNYFYCTPEDFKEKSKSILQEIKKEQGTIILINLLAQKVLKA